MGFRSKFFRVATSHIPFPLIKSTFLLFLLASPLFAQGPKPVPVPSPSKSRGYKIGDTKDEPNPFGEVKPVSKWEQFLSLGAAITLIVTGNAASVDFSGSGSRIKIKND